MASSPVFVGSLKTTPVAFTNSDSANTKKTAHTAGSNGSKLVALIASSTETANARVIQVWLTRSATSYLYGSINVPVNSGLDGTTPNVDLLSLVQGLARDADGQVYLPLESGDTLQVSITTQVASGKEVDIISGAGDV